MSSAASGSGGASASSLSVQRGALPATALERLAATGHSSIEVLATAVNLVHFRYTGLGECDIKLKLSAVDPETGTVGAGAVFSCVYKRGHTLREAFDHTAAQIKAAVETIDKSAGAGPSLDVAARPPFCIELFQLISAELASSGFQHLCHITINATLAAAAAPSAGGGGGKKKKAAAAAAAAAAGSASYNARYEFPPMLTAGQADPRLRVSQHLPCMLEELAKLATDDVGSSASSSSSSSPPALGLAHPLHHIQFLPKSERQNLMGIWSGLQAFDSVDRTDQLLQELFEETARKFPDRIAIECSAPSFRSMTYAQMSRRTNQLANWMRNNGVSVGSYVGMWLPRGMEVYIALIAILKAGAAYVPIDSEYPSDRVNFICDDCKAPVLITHSELLAEHPDFVLPDGCQKIEYDRVDALLEEQDTSFPTREITGQTNRDVCYVIYTSGSTGRPKGCQLEHRSAVNLVRAERILFGVHENDRVYQGFSIAFDASVEEVWLAFASGATLVAATPDMLHAGPGLPAMLNEQRITIVSTVPTLLSMMEDTLPNIRILISGGEAVQKDIIKRWSKGRRFINTYGPTEATVIATHVDTDPLAPLVTIGRAVPSYFLYILDADLNPCPVGVAGELHIGGLCVARGYLNRPDLTAEKFIPYPVTKLWNESPDEEEVQLMAQRSPRLYKAGDLCRWTEDGEVEFCGRIDQQVKLRGFRVELSEIESVLMTQPNIQSSVVSVREDVPGIQNLIGYVILKDPALPFSQDDLKEGIRVRLPPYMIPACIEVLTKFPTLPSGKVNRKELPPPKNLVVIDFDADPDEAEASGAAAGASSSSSSAAGDAKSGEIVPKNLDAARAAAPVDPNYFPPRSPLEKKLAQMWRKLFQRAKISTTDDFFTLGGHSLLAAWLVSALRKDAATEHVTMADVYGFPKLRDMACKLSGGDPADLPEPAEEAAMALAASLADVAAGGSGGADRKASGAGSERKDAEDPGSPGDGGDGIDLPMMSGGGGGSGGGANGLSEESGMDPLRPHPLESFAPISNLRFIVCGFFQLLALYFLYALPALQIGVPWELYLLIREGDWTYIIIMLLPFSVAIFPIYVLVTLAAKWMLIGRYREGKHRLWGWYYFRWWIVQRLMYYCPLIYLRGSPVLNLFYKALGAKLGRNVFLNTHLIEAPDLVEIGEDTSIGIDAQITNFHVEGNWLYIRRVVIGKCCYVGARSVVSGGSVMCDHAQLGAMSLLTQGTTIPPWEHWRGSPALRTARVENYMARNVARNKGKLAGYGSNGLKNRNNGTNGKKKAIGNGIGLNASDGDDNGVISSSSLMENSDALYDSDGEGDLESGPRSMARPKSFRGPSGMSSSFLGNAGLTEHLLSEDSQAQEVYVGVGEESLAWTIARPSFCARFLLGAGQSIFLTFVLPCMILLAIAPGMYLLHQLLPTDVSVLNVKAERDDTFKYLAAAAPMALSFTLILAWEITVMKWMLIGQIQPGDYRIHSWFYLRKWCVDTLLQLSIQVIHPIYSTVLIVPWFRSLGAIVGDRCEIATAVYAAPDLIEMGDECFIADTVYLGVPAVHMGTIRLAKISLGSRVFIGNGACLPMQTVIGNNCLVGVMSAPPLAYPLGDASAVMHWPEPALRAEHGTAWLGNPAMFLPNRQQPQGTFSDSTTYHPSIFLQLGRLFFELFKLTLPLMLFIMSMLLLLGDFQLIRVRFHSVWQFWLIWPLLYMSAGIGCCFVTLLVKWLLIGKYIAGEWPLWSSFIWRHDLVTSLLDSLVHPFFANQLRGTPFLPLWFRLMGSDIGARVWLDSTAITEPDLVHIGDDTAIHTDAQLQTHLFEDRILKCSHLRIGKKCSIGNSAIVLYDSLMNEGSHLLPLSLLMKGESLPAWSSWQGVPAHQCRNIGAEAPVVMHQITKEELAGK